MYPKELFHNSNQTYRVVHSLEEHSQRKLQGWVDHRTEGVAYRVHTSVPPLTPEQLIASEVSTCPKCEVLKERFKAAYDKLTDELNILKAQAQSGSAVNLRSQIPAVEDGASAVDAGAGDAPPLGGPLENYLTSGKRLTPEQKKSGREASRFKAQQQSD